MAADTTTPACPFCGQAFVPNGPTGLVVYKTITDRWYGESWCRECRYHWTAHGLTEEQVMVKLLAGGDSGEIVKLPTGQVVVWEGRHGAGRLTGSLLAYLRPGESAASALKEYAHTSGYQHRFQERSRNRRCLMEVSRRGCGGKALKPWYYAPRACDIEDAAIQTDKGHQETKRIS